MIVDLTFDLHGIHNVLLDLTSNEYSLMGIIQII